ncbi:hypothetical protein AB1Y20_017150 [Prymnesium parvum]|uniref:Uncharacterized protein n=1 Tax=Prymnesium parvum TaxID=97485 RepID=A0AB34ICR4_PRYPA
MGKMNPTSHTDDVDYSPRLPKFLCGALVPVMKKAIDDVDLGRSPVDGRAYVMGGYKPFNPKGGVNPMKDILEDDLKDAHATLPKKLAALEDTIEDFMGKPHRFRAEVMGEFGSVTSRPSFKDEPDYVRCMDEIKAAVQA